jgi:phytoene dehydrogenase-like protein
MGTDADVVVIGAGHNGLVAACYLARAGLRVTVCEAADDIGGMTSSFAPIVRAPQHLINAGAVDLTFLRANRIEHELELARYGFRHVEVDPPFVHLADDGASLAIWRDPAKTADEISAFSRADAETYLRLARTMDTLLRVVRPIMGSNPLRPSPRAIGQVLKAVARRPRDVPELVSFVLGSTAQFIEERFEHAIVRDMLATTASTVTDPRIDGGALPMMFIGFLHGVGASRPVGGMGALPAALSKALHDFGGEVRCQAEVAEILVAGERAVGVRLASGEEIRASRGVLAACDPQMALRHLLPGGTGDRRVDARVRNIPVHTQGGAWCKVDLALSGRTSLRRHQAQRKDCLDLRMPAAVIGTFADAVAGWSDSAAGRFPSRPIMYAVVPTAVDPSQAPPGEDTLYLWVSPAPAHPEQPWEAIASSAADTVVRRASEFYDDLDELELGRWVETPADAARRLRVTDGSLMHVDLTLTRLGPLRPARGLGGYRTPVEGLYLGAAGSHPGGGVSGLPGRLAAQEILRDTRSSVARRSNGLRRGPISSREGAQP